VRDPADVRPILELMDGYFKAANAKDSAALDAVLTDKTILLEPHMAPLARKAAIGKMHQAFLDNFDTDAQMADGKPVNVAAQLAELKAGLVQIESITLRDMRAHVFGDAAIVSMEAESKVTYKGKPVSEKSRGVDFFVKRDGRWQIVNSQMTTIKP